jgi:hypothetical protein
MSDKIYSIQEFNIVESNIKKAIDLYGDECNFTEKSIGFIFFFLERFYSLQIDEIEGAITDSNFIMRKDNFSKETDYPHDRGIDAIIINEEEKIIHLFNFKYKSNFEDTKKYFEAKEIDKVLGFIRDIIERNLDGLENANPRLKEKVKEIIFLQDKKYISFNYKIHFVLNGYLGFTDDEEKRLKVGIEKYRGVEFEYNLLDYITENLFSTEKNINGKFRAVENKYFEKLEYGYKASIFEVKAEDAIRLTLSNEDVRNNPDASIVEIKNLEIDEDAFEDNVRVYLKQKTSVNKSIKNSALTEENSLRFFYFNNGITITCNKLSTNNVIKSPIISLEGLQVVNGGQTIHSLKEALEEDSSNFPNISVLCRVYETNDKNFKSKICEYTNNQNPVIDRDIRSINEIQIKLEEELKLHGFFYERKKNQYENEILAKRIDAEKLGQAMLAFYLELPMEAKNRKRVIFGEKYEDIFNCDLTAKKALLAYDTYKYVETQKKQFKERKPFLNHATYYIVFFMKKIVGDGKDLEDYKKSYDEAVSKIEKVIEKEKERLGSDYFDAHLFKSNRPKDYLTSLGL